MNSDLSASASLMLGMQAYAVILAWGFIKARGCCKSVSLKQKLALEKGQGPGEGRVRRAVGQDIKECCMHV